MEIYPNSGLLWLNEAKYSRMDQLKFVEDSFLKIWSDMVCLGRPYHLKFFKPIFLNFYLSILEYFFSSVNVNSK